MGPEETIVAIVAIMAIATVVKAIFGGGRKRELAQQLKALHGRADAENGRLQDEVRGLKERVAVLERLATDRPSVLDREFDKLKLMD
jgi:hypothetical protein